MPATLGRRLGLSAAVAIGMASMLGAGVFVVFAPATALAGGPGMLTALVVAAVIAACNAISSARLAERYPESGGTYVYGRERLNPFAGFCAGWGFVIGKTASCAAMALALGSYLVPEHARLAGITAVVVLTAVNLAGVTKTARVAVVLLTTTLLVLGVVVGLGLANLPAAPDLGDTTRATPYTVLGAAGLLFFAFAGYARIATLGEEVRDPHRTITRAIAIALTAVVAIYAVTGFTALAVLGQDGLAATATPLADIAGTFGSPAAATVVRIGAGLAVAGVLLSLLAGIGRTSLAMARRSDLPTALAVVSPRFKVPQRAELLIAAVVIAVVSVADLRGAIGFSSFAVLVYYAIANASAYTLDGPVMPRAIAVLGLVGCVAIAVSLPITSVLAGLALFIVGALWYVLRTRS